LCCYWLFTRVIKIGQTISPKLRALGSRSIFLCRVLRADIVICLTVSSVSFPQKNIRVVVVFTYPGFS